MKLHEETVTPKLIEILHDLMDNSLFNPFRLVGGTSLSLRLGHRKSVDIDLFTDAPYGSLNFDAFETYFKNRYPYYDCVDFTNIVSFGRSYYLGESDSNCIKVDLFYHDEMINPCELLDGIRMASLDDVTAMKIDVVLRGGRKKDFWDIHALFDRYPLAEMLELHMARYEYIHDRGKILTQLVDFTAADDDMDPFCLKGNVWELIKLDIAMEVGQLT